MPAAPPPAAAPAPADASPALVLATAGADRTVGVWLADTGELFAVLRGATAEIASVAIRSDGKLLAAGAADGSLTLWNLQAAGPQTVLTSEGGPITAAARSADGTLLATGGVLAGRPAILVRDLRSGRTLHTLLGHEGPVTSLAFSPDARRLVSGSSDRTARAWDLADAKFPEVTRFTGHAEAVTAVALSADGGQALSGSAAGKVKLWNVADGKELADLAGHTGAIVAVAWSAAQPVSAAADATIRVWNPAGGPPLRTISQPGPITALAVSRDGANVAAGLADKTVRVHRLSDGVALHTLTAHQGEIRRLDFSADGSRLLSGDPQAAVVWSVAQGRLLEILPAEAGLGGALFGPTPDTVLLADAAGTWAQHTLRFTLALGDMKQPVTAVTFNNSGDTLFSACADGTVRGFTVANGQQLFAANHGAAVHDLALSPDGQRLASAGEDKLIKLWNPSGGGALQPPQLAGFGGPVRRVSFSGDGKRVAGGTAEAAGQILVFNLEAAGLWEQSLVGHAGPIDALVAAGDGLLAAGGGAVLPWQLLAVRSLAGHTQPVTALAAVPTDPNLIVSGSADGTLRRWNVDSGQAVAQLNHGGPVTAVAVRPDGQRMASTSANNTLKLWDANGGQLAELRGDIRAQKLVAKLTQEKNDTTQRVAVSKTAADAAEKDLPVKTEAANKAAAALAAAQKDVETKSAALATVVTAKTAAEQAAIESAAMAQKANLEMERAMQRAAELAAKAKLLADKAALAKTAAAADPNNTALAQVAATSSVTAGSADAEAKAAESAKTAPTSAATNAAQMAATAADKATAMTKPYTDAATAVEQAQNVQRTAQQNHEIAARELKAAQDAVPAVRDQLAKAEAALKQLDADLAAATKAEAAAQQPLRTVVFSPDGRSLATGGDLGIVHTWDAETGKALTSYVGHKAAIQTLCYVSDAELVTGSADKSAVIWELNPPWRLERVLGKIEDPSILVDRVLAVAFSPNGKLLATGGGVPSRSGEIKIWNTDDGSLVQAIPEAHNDAVNSLAFSPDGASVASAASDKYLKRFDVATGRQLAQFEGHTNHALGVAWRAGGQMLASCGADGTLRFWNADTGDRLVTVEGYTKQVTGVRFVGQTQFVVSSSGERLVRMHNSDNGGVQRDYPGATEYMYCIDVTPDGGLIAAGGHDGVLRLWNGNTGQLLQSLAAPQDRRAAGCGRGEVSGKAVAAGIPANADNQEPVAGAHSAHTFPERCTSLLPRKLP